MAKIGVVSDTHDHLIAIRKIVKFFNEEGLDYVIHCGDIISPFAAKEFLSLQSPWIAVFGNNDGERKGLQELLREKITQAPYTLVVEGQKIVVNHYPVKEMKEETTLYLFGHTHQCFYEKSPWQVNPGEGCGYLTGKSSVAIVDTVSREVVFKEIEG